MLLFSKVSKIRPETQVEAEEKSNGASWGALGPLGAVVTSGKGVGTPGGPRQGRG